jgi:5'-nucleotidase
MTIDRTPVDPAKTYHITVNNFLASGGDGFSVFAANPDAFDAGLDLDALDAYLAGGPSIAGERVR